MLLDDGQQEFIVKLKRYVHLEVLLAALSRNQKQLSHLKMADIYGWLIDQTIDRILKDMTELRGYFRRSPGEIIEIKQEPEYRYVSYKYKGYRQEMKFLNEWMRVECGEILKEYLRHVE
jgi:hypothetical protein